MQVQASNPEKSKTSFITIILIILYVVSFIFYAYFLVSGSDFYLTAFQKQPHHTDYRNLRPAGNLGHAFGIIGSTMMILMLLYSVRKRTRRLQKLGYLSSWLRVHIYFGIIGPMLIILHSSFKVQGLIAVSFWSMIAVALSGLLGRYLYIQIPRTIVGNEIDFKELEQMNQNLAQEIFTKFQIEKAHLEYIEASLFPAVRENKGLIGALFSLIFSDITRPFRNRRLRKHLVKKLNLSTRVVSQMMITIRRKVMLQRKISMWNAIHQLFHYWHVIHKPFAIIMYIIMFVHVMVAVYVGYTWMF
jgi:hypothetical protein